MFHIYKFFFEQMLTLLIEFEPSSEKYLRTKYNVDFYDFYSLLFFLLWKISCKFLAKMYGTIKQLTVKKTQLTVNG